MSSDARIQFDHADIPVTDVERSVEFYSRLLAPELIGLEEWRAGKREHVTLGLGDRRLNLRPLNSGVRLVNPAHFCFAWTGAAEAATAHLTALGIPITTGPGIRFGSRGRGTSVYFDDPDGNHLEIIAYSAG